MVRECATRVIDGEPLKAFIIARTITLKATPMAMVFDPFQETVVYISTIDRFIHRYDVQTGRIISAFKTGDSEGGDAVVMSSLVAIPTLMGGAIIAGLSSTDKSIRIYEETGTMLARDWGHTEGVTDIAVLGRDAIFDANGLNNTTLVTVALDGTIFSWKADLSPRKRHDAASRSMDSGNATPNGTPNESLMSRPPLRRVLSQSEIARFQRSPDVDDTPTRLPGQRSPPRIRKRTSRLSLMHTPKLEPSPSTKPDLNRRRSMRRSPSPPSPRSSARQIDNPKPNRRQSLDPTSRRISLSKAKSVGNLRESSASFTATVGSHSLLARDTDSVCRALRIFRRKLASSTELMPPDMVRELEKELSGTMRALGEKVMQGNRRRRESDRRGGGDGGRRVDEEVLGRVLDQYSERLVEMLDVRLAGLALNNGSGGERDRHAAAGAEAVSGSGADTHRTDSLVESIEEHEDERKE